MHRHIGAMATSLLAGSIISACAQPDEVSVGTLRQAMSSISAAQTDTAVLGQAYHSDQKKVMNLSCVAGESELRGNSVSELSYEKDMSFDDMLNSLAGGLSVGFKLPVVSAEASAELATKHASTSLSETHHLVWVGSAKKEVFRSGTLKLSELGEYYANTRTDLLESRCGNEFITEVHRGASFHATMKIEFFNSEDRLEIGGKVKVNVLVDLVDVEGSLKYVDENKKKRTKLSVQVVQRGGRPEGLLTIIPENVMYCSLDDPTPCLAVFRNLILYAKNDFSAQLTNDVQYNVLKYVTQSYGDSGMEALVPSQGYAVIQEAVRQKIELTERKLREALQDEDRASSLQTTGAAYMTTKQLDKVRAVAVSAGANVVVYADVSRYCYQNMNDKCLTYATSRDADVQAYNRADLDVKPAIVADVNEDGCVDTADYDIFVLSYGKTVAGGADAKTDFNKDGKVDDADYIMLSNNWGKGCSS